MKKLDLGTTTTFEFGDHIIIGLDKKFLKLNDGKQLVFDAIISENGKLVLSTSLGLEDRTNSSTKEVDNNVM